MTLITRSPYWATPLSSKLLKSNGNNSLTPSMKQLIRPDSLSLYKKKKPTYLDDCIINRIIHAFWLILIYDLMRTTHRWHNHQQFSSCYYVKQIDSMSLWVSTVIYCWRPQKVVRPSVTHSATPCLQLFLFFDPSLTSSVIYNYYCTDAHQHGIYSLTK